MKNRMCSRGIGACKLCSIPVVPALRLAWQGALREKESFRRVCALPRAF